jgi:translation elongation factor EF-1alpha
MDDLVSAAKKPHLNLIIIGHVDHGKSTMTGHLLFATGNIDEKTIKKYADESTKLGVGETFKFAWVLDTLRTPRLHQEYDHRYKPSRRRDPCCIGQEGRV